MKSGELIGVRAFPAVVQAADIAALREQRGSEAAQDFIGGFLGFDERARFALSTSLQALSQAQHGSAFFLNGVFGSGKSHLLGLLALLCDGTGHEYFLQTHPHFTNQLANLPKYFVVHFSLDEYEASRFSLEEIVKREIALEWFRCFDEGLAIIDSGTRGEYFLALEEALQQHGYNAIFIGIDELSLFLSAKEHRALQADAAFLQFLGQRAARSTPCQLHIFAALQKTVEDIGDLEAYSLSQIRDRFATLNLSLAHLPSLIQHRLIVRKDEAALQNTCRESYDQLQRALPRIDFGSSEWQQLYPFHPATVALLEQVVVRFFSRTRSAVLFCAEAAQHILEEDAASRVLPHTLLDYLAPELNSHPDLRQLANVWNTWSESLQELANDRGEVAVLQRLMKTLLLFRMSGIAPNVIQLANAISLDANLGGERNYEYARVLLERLRTRGSFVAVEHNEGEWQDRYAVDTGTRVSELARRHLKNALHELKPHDVRVPQFVLSCCREEPLPLASLSAPRSFSIQWRNAPREISVELWQRSTSTQHLQNRVALLSEPGTPEEFLILIVPPFTSVARESFSSIRDGRYLLWTPRLPTDDEWQFASEATAAHLLEEDPQLLDNRRGRAILEHLKDAATARQAQMLRLANRLLREGALQFGNDVSFEASELATSENWQSTLEAIAELVLSRVYPKFEEVSPRLRVLTPSNVDALCLEILRRPIDEPYFGATHERIARALCEPLGIARAEKGRWKIASPRNDLKDEVLHLARDVPTLSTLDAYFSKSEWGLKSEQLAPALCSLLRSGELVSLDARGQALQASKIGMPLRRSVHAVRPGDLLDENRWLQLQGIVQLFTNEKLGPRSFEEQERARLLLSQWHDETQAQFELATARFNQLRRALHDTEAPWPRTQSTLASLSGLLHRFEGFAPDSITDLNSDTLQPIVMAWREMWHKLETGQAGLLTHYALLSHPELSAPPELQSVRRELLARFQSGEAVLDDGELLRDAAQWREEYARQYQEWHEAQHNSTRWNSLRRLLGSDELRALERVTILRSRPFPAAQVLREEIENELRKQCPRDGVLLPGEATCNACRLRFGQRVLVRDPNDVTGQIAQIFAAFATSLREDPVREYLNRHGAERELLQWDGDGATLLPILSDEVLALLDEAFKPRRRVERSMRELEAQLKNCRTLMEFEQAFSSWLDSGENLSSDDEIEVRP